MANYQDNLYPLQCYGIALKDLERPATTWVQLLATYLYYLGGVSETGNRGFRPRHRAPFQSYIAL